MEFDSALAGFDIGELPLDLASIVANFVSYHERSMKALVVTCHRFYDNFSLKSSELKSLAYKFGSFGYFGLLAWRASKQYIPDRNARLWSHIAGQALGEGLISVSKMIIEKHSLVPYLDPTFWTAVGVMARKSNLESFEMEFSKMLGASNVGFKCRESLLVSLVQNSNFETLKWVMDKFCLFDERSPLKHEPYFRSIHDTLVLYATENPGLLVDGSYYTVIDYFHSKHDMYITDNILSRLCEKGDVKCLQHCLEKIGCSFVTRYSSRDYHVHPVYLTAALKSGNPELFQFLKSKGCAPGDKISPLLIIKSGHLEIIRCAMNDSREFYDRQKLMLLALEAEDEKVWDFCLNELGGRLSSDCYATALRRMDEKAMRWLHDAKCPVSMGRLLRVACEGGLPHLKFLLATEDISLSDKQIASLFAPNQYDIVSWVLREHRPDYKLVSEDVRNSLATDRADLIDRFIKLFLAHGYIWTRDDFFWFLVNYDIKYHNDGHNTLAEKLIKAGFIDLDEGLATEAISYSCDYAKFFAVKMLKQFGCQGIN